MTGPCGAAPGAAAAAVDGAPGPVTRVVVLSRYADIRTGDATARLLTLPFLAGTDVNRTVTLAGQAIGSARLRVFGLRDAALSGGERQRQRRTTPAQFARATRPVSVVLAWRRQVPCGGDGGQHNNPFWCNRVGARPARSARHSGNAKNASVWNQ